MRKVTQERALAILSPIAVLVLWQLASDVGMVDQRYVPSPVAIAKAGWSLAATGELEKHVWASCGGWRSASCSARYPAS